MFSKLALKRFNDEPEGCGPPATKYNPRLDPYYTRGVPFELQYTRDLSSLKPIHGELSCREFIAQGPVSPGRRLLKARSRSVLSSSASVSNVAQAASREDKEAAAVVVAGGEASNNSDIPGVPVNFPATTAHEDEMIVLQRTIEEKDAKIAGMELAYFKKLEELQNGMAKYVSENEALIIKNSNLVAENAELKNVLSLVNNHANVIIEACGRTITEGTEIELL